jgi:glycosyltransferase involved in cell wall biosynthesis
MVKYSILSTTYNAFRTIRKSLKSVLTQIDDDFEIIVVDNFSDDGTLEYLRSLSEGGRIRLLVAKCNRGEGRQIALEHARGEYVIAKVDYDLIYKPVFKRLLEYYVKKERKLDDFVLYANVMISSKKFLMGIGGWRPLQWGENYELYKRLIDMGKLYVCRASVNLDHMKFKVGFLGMLKTSYVNYRDSLRMRLKFRVIGKEILVKHGLSHCLPRFLILSLAWCASRFYEKYDAFENVTWEEFYRDCLYNDGLCFFEVHHPGKVLPPPQGMGKSKYDLKPIDLVQQNGVCYAL